MKSHWVTEKLYHYGDPFFKDMAADISAARNTIDFETYIFTRETLGTRLIALLGKAAIRGVRVRIHVDGVGSIDWDRAALNFLKQLGIEAKIYHPVPWHFLTQGTGTITEDERSYRFWFFKLGDFWKALWALNRRNHRKVCIIDSKIAYLGGINVSDTNLRQYSGDQAWRDTAARVEGKEVRKLTEAFELAWEKTRKKKITFQRQKANPQSLIKLNNTLERRRNLHKELIARTLRSHERVWLTTPYFIPEISLVRSLRYAARLGSDVRILVPKKNDIPFMALANRAYYSVLLEAGVKIYEYTPRILHAKVLLIDHWLLVGSSNRNHRSLIHDLEVDAVLTHEESITSAINQFKLDLKNSYQITFKEWQKDSWVNALFSKFILLFKYWL